MMSWVDLILWWLRWPGSRHSNFSDQVRESLHLVINHPACHSNWGPNLREATCIWCRIDVAMFLLHAEQKFTQLKVVKITTHSMHTVVYSLLQRTIH